MRRLRQLGSAILFVPLTGLLPIQPFVQPSGPPTPKSETPAPRAFRRSDRDSLPRPQLWLAKNGDSRVYIFGFGEAKDTSWLTPAVKRAFDQSSELWLETGGPSEAIHQSPAERRAATDRMIRLGREPGRTLFDVLEPSLRDRMQGYIDELGIDQDSIQRLRPWKAYYSIVGAFWSKRPATHNQVDVDAVFASMARAAGKSIDYEFPNGQVQTFFALMPNEAQNQYLEWLLDFLDDYKIGHNDATESFRWISGEPGDGPTRSLDRMRAKMPDLYRVMQQQRNGWWARKVFELLGTRGTRFIAIGQLHVLGPDGLPRQLERLGVSLELVR